MIHLQTDTRRRLNPTRLIIVIALIILVLLMGRSGIFARTLVTSRYGNAVVYDNPDGRSE